MSRGTRRPARATARVAQPCRQTAERFTLIPATASSQRHGQRDHGVQSDRGRAVAGEQPRLEAGGQRTQDGRAEQQAGDDLADDRRLAQAAGRRAEDMGRAQQRRQPQEEDGYVARMQCPHESVPSRPPLPPDPVLTQPQRQAQLEKPEDRQGHG